MDKVELLSEKSMPINAAIKQLQVNGFQKVQGLYAEVTVLSSPIIPDDEIYCHSAGKLYRFKIRQGE